MTDKQTENLSSTHTNSIAYDSFIINLRGITSCLTLISFNILYYIYMPVPIAWNIEFSLQNWNVKLNQKLSLILLGIPHIYTCMWTWTEHQPPLHKLFSIMIAVIKFTQSLLVDDCLISICRLSTKTYLCIFFFFYYHTKMSMPFPDVSVFLIFNIFEYRIFHKIFNIKSL